MTKINTDDISKLIMDIADEYIMPRFKLLQNDDINTKSGPNDLVTVADIESEQALEIALGERFPNSIVVGEEGISSGSKAIELMQKRDGIIWVADPVDGTYNFVHGRPEFALMLACVIDGETRHGWIYDIPARRMMKTEKGAGAFMDGERLQVSAPTTLAEATGYMGLRYFPADLRTRVKEFVPLAKDIATLGCSGHEYLRLVAGIRDFSISPRTRVWDHLPGSLAFQEAGGIVRRWDGRSYAPQDDGHGIYMASSEALADELHRAVIQHLV